MEDSYARLDEVIWKSTSTTLAGRARVKNMDKLDIAFNI